MAERKALIQKYRNYYYGELGALYSGFLSRFKDSDVVTPLTQQNFVSQNEIRAVIDKRVSLVPADGIKFTAMTSSGSEDKERTKWLSGWLEGTNFGEGRSFNEFIGEVLVCLELDGEAALKLILRNGVPQVRRIPDEALEIVTNPDNVYEVTAYIATFYRDVEGEDFTHQVQIKETIDAARYLVEIDGKEQKQPHKFGFIPVVLIKREDEQGSPHGRSGAADLMEFQDNLNRCLTNIARANKYGPWGLYCTEDTGAPLPDGDVTVAPGSLVATPIRKVSGEGAAECLFREKEELLDAMYRVAGISRNKADEIAQSDRTSGKAMVVLNAQGKRYVSNLMARLKRGFSRMAESALVMSGQAVSLDQVSVQVEFPSIDTEVPEVVLEKARLLFAAGYSLEALRVLGYEDGSIENIVKENDVKSALKRIRDGREYDA